MMMKFSDHITRFACQQARFEGNKSHGGSGIDHRPRRRARLRDQSRGNIQRDNGRGMRVRLFNKIGDVFAWSLFEASTEQAIHNKIDILWPDDIRRVDYAPGVQPGVTGLVRLFWQRLVTLQGQERNIHPLCGGQPGDDITIAAVIAVPAQDEPVSGEWVRFSCDAKRRITRTEHQLVKGDTQTVGGLFFCATQGVRRPNGMWYTCGDFLHRMVRHVTAPRSQSVSAKH
ncbi:hypothetical protein D3C72_912170 [compost metagenome]